MNNIQEKALSLIDDLIDDDVDVMNLGVSLRNHPKYNYESVRTRLKRSFGSVENALKAYGLFEKNGVPTRLELERCFSISDDYKVIENEWEILHLKDLYFLSDLEFIRLTREIILEVKRDAIDDYLRDHYPDGMKHTYIKENGFYHIRGYLKVVYSDSFEFINTIYGLPTEIITRWGGHLDMFSYGNEFELLVREVLEALHGACNVDYQKRINDCIPDFIIHEKDWIDAKLSFGTAFDRNCTTVEKYGKHTSSLSIIYACDRHPKQRYNGALLRHVSEYYSSLIKAGYSELVVRIKEFIVKVETRKRELQNRVS